MPTFAELASAALAAKEPYGPTASADLSAKGNAGEYASAQLAANGGYAASAALAAKTPSYAEYDSATLGTGVGLPPLPPGFIFLVDIDMAFLTDTDGAIFVEPI